MVNMFIATAYSYTSNVQKANVAYMWVEPYC